MKKTLCCLILWSVALACLLCPAPLRAEGGVAFVLNSLSVVFQQGLTRLEAAIAVSDPAPLQANLRDGAALNLQMDVLVEHPRMVLPDKTISQQRLLFQIRFDPLTREYILLQQAKPPVRQRRLAALLDGVLGDATIPLAPPAILMPGEQYRVSITLAMRHADVPPWLERTLFFWSWDVIAPTTYTLDFVCGENGSAALENLNPAETGYV